MRDAGARIANDAPRTAHVAAALKPPTVAVTPDRASAVDVADDLAPVSLAGTMVTRAPAATAVASPAPAPATAVAAQARPGDAQSVWDALAGTGPAAPTEGPIGWMVLAAVRRRPSGAQPVPAATVTTGQAAVAAALPTAATAANPVAYLADFAANAVIAVDTVTYNTKKITDGIGRAPAGLAVNPAGTLALVPNMGDGTVSVIDTAKGAVTKIISVGKTPVNVVFSPDGSRAYVISQGDFVNNTPANGVVSVIDTTASGGPVLTATKYTVGAGPVGAAVSGSKLYVVNNFGDSVSLIDTTTGTVKTVEVGYSPQAVAFSKDGTSAYVTNSGDYSISVIDTAKGEVKPGDVAVFRSPFALAVTPTGKLLVSNINDNSVTVISGSALNLSTPIPISGMPGQVAVSAAGDFAYVSHGAGSAPAGIAVIDLATNKVIKDLPAGVGPGGLALATGITTTPPTPTPSKPTITPSATRINEGQTLTTTVSAPGVATGTTFYWSVVPKESNGAVTVADFSSGALTGSGTLRSNGKFEIVHTLSNDKSVNEAEEEFQIKLYSDSARKTEIGATPFIKIKDTSGSWYELSLSTFGSINEGEKLTTRVNTYGVTTGTTLYWSVLQKDANGGLTAADFSRGALQGTDTLGANGVIEIIHTLAEDKSVNENDEAFRLALYTDSARKNQVAVSPFVTVKDTSKGAAPTYSISPSSTTINEGQTLTTTVSTTSVANGTKLYWTVLQKETGGGVTSGDFSSGALEGSGAVGSDGRFSILHTLSNDQSSNEKDEQFQLVLYSDSIRQTQVAWTPYITVKDTSKTSADSYRISPSVTTINEGQTLTTTVTAGSSAAGKTLYWRVEAKSAGGGVYADDFSSGALQGSGVLSRTNSGSQMSVSHTLSMDWSTVKKGTYPGEFSLSPNQPEGDEQFQISFYSDSAFKTPVGSTPLVTVKDTARSGIKTVYTDWTGARFQKLTKDAKGNYAVAYVDGTVTFTSSYYKYYGQGKEKTQVMLEQPWIPGRPTIVYAHGWKDSAGTKDPNSTSQLLFNALHERYGATHNILLVDWSTLAADTGVNPPGVWDVAGAKQPTAEITVTKQVGETVARMLLDNNVDPAQLTLIGHSLGSYVMSAAAQYIAANSKTKVAKLVGLDPAWGVDYDIDARNGWGKTNQLYNDRPIPFKTDIATSTRTYTASDLESSGKVAGDNEIAATAEFAYLVQYSKTDFAVNLDIGDPIARYHNAIIPIYGDLVRKGIEDPKLASGISFENQFDTYGLPYNGPFDGVIVAAQPWVTDPKAGRSPKVIGWTNGYRGITIWGSPKSDVMYHDRFAKGKVGTGGTKFYGGDGDDFLVGDRPYDNIGIDELYGGKGSDTFVFGYRRYAENLLPYDDKWSTDPIGWGLTSYAVIKDFNPKEDKLYLAIGKGNFLFRKAGDIDASLTGGGVGLLYNNKDLFAYIPGLSYEDASAFLNDPSKTKYVTFDLDRELFQDLPRTSEFFG